MSPVPVTVTARSKVWTVFARSNAGIMGSNPTRGMDICVRLFCVCVVLCRALRRADPPAMESYQMCTGLRNWKSDQGPTNGRRAIDEWMNGLNRFKYFNQHFLDTNFTRNSTLTRMILAVAYKHNIRNKLFSCLRLLNKINIGVSTASKALKCVDSGDLTAVTTDSKVFWNVTPCSSESN
jgi:hypothetical protein